MLSKLGKVLNRRKSSSIAKQSKSQASVSLWEDTGQVYYLENTLKLTYQSKSGAITMEKLSLESLAEVIKEIESRPASSPLARVSVANQVSAYAISVCAVTWQKRDDSIRLKAIPDAAILRSATGCFSRSQAIFRHAFLLEHDDLLSPSLSSAKAGVYTYNRVSITDFTAQIEQANARLGARYRRAISVNPENFDSAFTTHESEVIEALLDGPEQAKMLDK